MEKYLRWLLNIALLCVNIVVAFLLFSVAVDWFKEPDGLGMGIMVILTFIALQCGIIVMFIAINKTDKL